MKKNFIDSALNTVVLVLPVLCFGGAERCMVNMANWWAARGVKVYLITFHKDVQDYELDSRIIWLGLDDYEEAVPAETVWTEENYNIACLRKAIEFCLASSVARPLPVISFLTRMNLRTILATKDLPCRTVVSERSYPPSNPFPEREEKLRCQVYPQAHKVVLQTETGRDFWGRNILTEEKMSVIPNPVSESYCSETFVENNFVHGSNLLPDSRFLVTAGRLECEKRIDHFIRLFSVLVLDFPEINALVLGEGSLREELEALVCAEGLEDRVHMPGALEDLKGIFEQAELFVLTSKFEGFPNVLLESMASGCPVLSYDCLTGPREIIRDGVDGILIPPGDEHALQQSAKKILGNDALRFSMAREAKSVCERFHPDKIMLNWEKFF
ncbi:glycosyltransferase [Maridesulfovibrio sp.]|uniref:glycosyltransferase n=1 Tax=Maridesulfovibrio sp. TaxID=2795000 RepID=UPI002A18BBCF|nr:glycosyltransferase [Maridesulfovibrio sp.]